METSTSFFGTGMTTADPSMATGDVLWMLISGFIMSFMLACGLGANDVANSFATSVGAKVLTLPWACVLASIFETAGAVLLGAKVSDTIRKGIFDVGLYDGQEEVLMLGQVCALGGACIWLLLATWLKMPVSGTHSIVGAMLGFHLVVFQLEGIAWKQFGFIVGSWFLSPVMSGFVSSIIFVIYRKIVIDKENPLEPGLRVLPFFYALVLILNCISIFIDGPEMLYLHVIPVWGVMILSFGVGIITGLIVFFFLVPRWRKQLQVLSETSTYTRSDDLQEVKMDTDVKIPLSDEGIDVDIVDGKMKEENEAAVPVEQDSMISSGPSSMTSSPDTKHCTRFGKLNTGKWKRLLSKDSTEGESRQESEAWKSVKDHPVVAKLCTPLQILSAIFAAFAHGGNDVSNAIGPLVALWTIYANGNVDQKSGTPIWILVYGGAGITIGLWLLGRRVIETVGSNLTPITPSSGFSIELGAAATVLLASNIGIPISTTHCKVGSVVAIGKVRSAATVQWRLFINIIIAWIVTVPATAAISAALMAGLLRVL
ncbi:sodium-dependent phosphate transporter 2 [Strongylocentrotus purpuratus]|uniref:Phosphate transporter n=1 Tax=Strongylocentrotus purpuratus TaxID=7668 RepID=A0A7M7TGV1_STRPU|nr:sodium-dependent phosphate transporter 2 [Strongylocentrotus purpuratus]|eukprot:XP_787652.2 PREDICTED: sodium-dependent phosphate transporter 2 [Strongylocentrotus purpuratus]